MSPQVPVQLFQIKDSLPSAILFGEDEKGAVKVDIPLLLFCATDCAPPDPVFPAAPDSWWGCHGGGVERGVTY